MEAFPNHSLHPPRYTAVSLSAPDVMLLRGAIRARPALFAVRRAWMSSLPPHSFLPMPALSPTMTSGNLLAWKKAEGDAINVGDVIADVETDKAVVDYEAQDEGFLAKILIPEGAQDVQVGENIAIIVEDADAIAAFFNRPIITNI